MDKQRVIYATASDPLAALACSRRASTCARRVDDDHVPRSDKIEFSFLNGNLIAPASQPFIFSCDTLPTMEEHMFGESTQILLFLAIVGLTVVSTIDLVMQPIKQGKSTKQGKGTDQEH